MLFLFIYVQQFSMYYLDDSIYLRTTNTIEVELLRKSFATNEDMIHTHNIILLDLKLKSFPLSYIKTRASRGFPKVFIVSLMPCYGLHVP